MSGAAESQSEQLRILKARKTRGNGKHLARRSDGREAAVKKNGADTDSKNGMIQGEREATRAKREGKRGEKGGQEGAVTDGQKVTAE